MAPNPSPSTRELALVFGRIGCLSFGGPAAQISLMEEELVSRRSWLSHDDFLRALSFCMLLPGPEAMQLATYAGWRLRGVWGGTLAGILFLVPGALSIFVLAALYISFGQLAFVDQAFIGLQASVIVVVIAAMRKLALRAIKGARGMTIAVLSFAAIFGFGVPFPLVVLSALVFGAVFAHNEGVAIKGRSAKVRLHVLVFWAALWGLPVILLWILEGGFLFSLSVFFSNLAIVTFGGAHAVLSYMTQTVVQDLGWLTTNQMIDALGLAETTPGPLILVTQFVGILAGHAIGGWPMAIAAGIVALWVTFTPCFLWIFAGAPYVERLTQAPRIASALSAVTAAAVGVLANLSLWFALHVLFDEIGIVRLGFASLPIPAGHSLSLSAFAFLVLAAGLTFWRHWSLFPTLATVTLIALLAGASGLTV